VPNQKINLEHHTEIPGESHKSEVGFSLRQSHIINASTWKGSRRTESGTSVPVDRIRIYNNFVNIQTKSSRHTHTHSLSRAMTETKVNTAPIKWAQRADFLYLTIDLHGVTKEVVRFTERELHFQGESEGKYFEAKIEFYQPILPKECSYQTHPLGVEMIVKKDKEHRSDGKEGFWPQLLKDKRLEKNEVTVDWKHYVDEDDDGNDDTEHPFLWSQ